MIPLETVRIHVVSLLQLLDHDNFKIVNVLTVPVINFEKNVVGVVQMINKFLGSGFNSMDVNSIEV